MNKSLTIPEVKAALKLGAKISCHYKEKDTGNNSTRILYLSDKGFQVCPTDWGCTPTFSWGWPSLESLFSEYANANKCMEDFHVIRED